MKILKSLSLAFASGAIGGAANVAFLVAAGAIGLTAFLGLKLPAFTDPAFVYKQIVWGGFWALLFVAPFSPNSWQRRGVLFGLAAACATLFFFFPQGSTETSGPGFAGLRVGSFMPLLVVMADLIWGLVASKVYDLTRE